MTAVLKKFLCRLDWEISTSKMCTSYKAEMPKLHSEVLQKNQISKKKNNPPLPLLSLLNKIFKRGRWRKSSQYLFFQGCACPRTTLLFHIICLPRGLHSLSQFSPPSCSHIVHCGPLSITRNQQPTFSVLPSPPIPLRVIKCAWRSNRSVPTEERI